MLANVSRTAFHVVLMVVVTAAMIAPAAQASELLRLLEGVSASDLLSGAQGIGEPVGQPPLVPVFGRDGQLGYIFLTSDFAPAVGYSGKPIHTLIGMDNAGVIRGVKIVEHHEPIVLVGISESRIEQFTEGYVGLDVLALLTETEKTRHVDIVSGATVTVMVLDDSILRAAIKVARRLGLGGLESDVETVARELDASVQDIDDWTSLIAAGSVRRLKLTLGDINRLFNASGEPAAIAKPELGGADELFIDLYAAVVSVPSLGRSLLGKNEYANLLRDSQPGTRALLVAAAGRYSFKGSGYVRGGIFDRFQIVQGERSLRFRDRQHKRLRAIAAEGAPEFREVSLFTLAPDEEFEQTAPWRLDLLVGRETGARSKAFLTASLDYQLPEKYMLAAHEAAADALTAASSALPVDDGPPLWKTLWRNKTLEIGVLSAALVLLSAIFFFQNTLTRHPMLAQRVRVGFLLFTLFGIGLYANAQLSVVNILTVFSALLSGFNWGYFLMEPLIFILWGSAAAALLFWGRGAYCGWLCPYGAAQELLNRLAKWLRIPQWRVPWPLHERLWAVKYLIFLALFGVSMSTLR